MLTSKSVKGCRLTAKSPAVIRNVQRTGLTTGRIGAEDCFGRSKRVNTAAKKRNPPKRQKGTQSSAPKRQKRVKSVD